MAQGLAIAKRHLLLISSSGVHGYGYLEYNATDIKSLYNRFNVSEVLFIPYALNDYEAYLKKVQGVFSLWGFKVNGIHHRNAVDQVLKAKAFFVGGGNTFQLLKGLYDNNIVEAIRTRVLVDGIPYVGTSAGTNVATRGIYTTNDMPIVYPPSFKALDLVPFIINPHYQDHDLNSTHKGETRDERILQYLEVVNALPVLALREGCSLLVEGNHMELIGLCNSRLYVPGQEPKEVDVGTDLSFLL